MALAALVGVIAVGILVGVVIGIVLSLVLLIHRFDHPHVAILGLDPSGHRFEDLDRHPDAKAVPNVLIYRLEAPLIFANADVVTDDLWSKIDTAEPRAIVLDLEAVYEIDTEGADTLVRLHDQLDDRGVSVALARTHGSVLDYLDRDGRLQVFDQVVFGSVSDAVDSLSQGKRTLTPAPEENGSGTEGQPPKRHRHSDRPNRQAPFGTDKAGA